MHNAILGYIIHSIIVPSPSPLCANYNQTAAKQKTYPTPDPLNR